MFRLPGLSYWRRPLNPSFTGLPSQKSTLEVCRYYGARGRWTDRCQIFLVDALPDRHPVIPPKVRYDWTPKTDHPNTKPQELFGCLGLGDSIPSKFCFFLDGEMIRRSEYEAEVHHFADFSNLSKNSIPAKLLQLYKKGCHCSISQVHILSSPSGTAFHLCPSMMRFAVKTLFFLLI